MSDYIIPAGYGEAEYIDKKSRFIGQVQHVESVSEAMAFVDAVRKKYADATHNVWAYVLADGQMRWSDDGEPGGTSGQPTLNVFRSANVCDVACVVTRYFGGTLLGSGGLVRAYSKAASMALEAAGRARMAEWRGVSVECTYAQYERIRRLLDAAGAADIEGGFGEFVTITALLPEGTAEPFGERLTDTTAGQARFTLLGSVFRPQRLDAE
ncbi:MAG TPA: YigZ family protein [Candidatus Scatomorpha gallistercoris]|nr:YigZ family protein [Candidatus Scatomorpha gallistercoris]